MTSPLPITAACTAPTHTPAVTVVVVPGDRFGMAREALGTLLRVTRVPQGSHWLIHEQPDAVNALIRAALA